MVGPPPGEHQGQTARQALGQTRVYGHEAGGVGDDGALCCGEVRRQGVGSQVGCGREGGHLALQRRDGGGVGADVGGVGGGCLEGRVGRQDGGQLPGRDALELYHRWGRFAVVQNSARECAWKEGHLLTPLVHEVLTRGAHTTCSHEVLEKGKGCAIYTQKCWLGRPRKFSRCSKRAKKCSGSIQNRHPTSWQSTNLERH